jgi:hypothetical protein
MIDRKAGRNGINGMQYLCDANSGICISPEIIVEAQPPQSYPSFDLEAFLAAWMEEFGERPVRISALLHRACSANSLAKALGFPVPSAQSLGRLLAARKGRRAGCGLELVRCESRHDNCALWQVRSGTRLAADLDAASPDYQACL